jgi:hypothetical protein
MAAGIMVLAVMPRLLSTNDLAGTVVRDVIFDEVLTKSDADFSAGIAGLCVWRSSPAKQHCNNWIADLSFVVPFSVLSTDFSWISVTGLEIIAAVN